MPIAFTKAEKNIIRKNYITKSAQKIVKLLKAESGIIRHESSIWTWACRAGIKKRTKKKRNPIIVTPAAPVSRIKPTLKNPDLFELQEEYGIRLGWIARLGDLSLEIVQDYVSQGGLPNWLEKKLYRYIEGKALNL